MKASPVSTPQSPNIVEAFFSYYSLPLPELNPLPHHVSSLPRTTKYTAILREKVWRALSRAAGFFLHQETSGVRCLGACPLTHPRIQVSAGCCPSSVQCNTARSRSLLNLPCLDGIVAYHWDIGEGGESAWPSKIRSVAVRLWKHQPGSSITGIATESFNLHRHRTVLTARLSRQR